MGEDAPCSIDQRRMLQGHYVQKKTHKKWSADFGKGSR